MKRIRTIEEKAHCLSELVKSIGTQEDEILWGEYATQKKSGIVNYIEIQLRELLDDILEKRVSTKDFKCKDAYKLSKVLECKEIDRELCGQLYHQIYGGDEANRNFGGCFMHLAP